MLPPVRVTADLNHDPAPDCCAQPDAVLSHDGCRLRPVKEGSKVLQLERTVPDAEVDDHEQRATDLRPSAAALVADLLDRIHGLRPGDLDTETYCWGRIDPVGTMYSGVANLWNPKHRLRRSSLSYTRLVQSFLGGRLVTSRGVWVAPHVFYYRVDGTAPVRHLHLDLDYDDFPELVALKQQVKTAHRLGELPRWGRAEQALLAEHPARRQDRELLAALGFHLFDSKSSGQHAIVLLSQAAGREQLRDYLGRLQGALQGRIECTNVGRLSAAGGWNPQPNLLPFPTSYPHQRPVGPLDSVLTLPELHPGELFPEWVPPAPSTSPAPAAPRRPVTPRPDQPVRRIPTTLRPALVAVIEGTLGLKDTAVDGAAGRPRTRQDGRQVQVGITAVPRHCWWQWIHVETKACFEFDPKGYPDQVRTMSPGIPEEVIQERLAKVEQATRRAASRPPATAGRRTAPLTTNSPSPTGDPRRWVTPQLVRQLWAAACEAYPPNRQTKGAKLSRRCVDLACGLLTLLLASRLAREPHFFATLKQQMMGSRFLSRHRALSYEAAQARYVNQVLNRLAPWVRRVTNEQGLRQRLVGRYERQVHGMAVYELTPAGSALLDLLPGYSGAGPSVYDDGQSVAAGTVDDDRQSPEPQPASRPRMQRRLGLVVSAAARSGIRRGRAKRRSQRTGAQRRPRAGRRPGTGPRPP